MCSSFQGTGGVVWNEHVELDFTLIPAITIESDNSSFVNKTFCLQSCARTHYSELGIPSSTGLIMRY